MPIGAYGRAGAMGDWAAAGLDRNKRGSTSGRKIAQSSIVERMAGRRDKNLNGFEASVA